MDSRERVSETFDTGIALMEACRTTLAEPIARAGALLAARLDAGHKIMSCGNGGSAAQAQHFSAEMLGRFQAERPGLAALALTADSATLTAIANDTEPDEIFARQIRALGGSGDVLLALSTSGRSGNVIAAVQAAHEGKMTVIALSGRDGGRLAGALARDDVEIRVPAEATARIQEIHTVALHCLCDLVDRQLAAS